MSAHQETDVKAGLTGFILGLIALLVIVYGIVQFTNHKYAGEKPAAEATK